MGRLQCYVAEVQLCPCRMPQAAVISRSRAGVEAYRVQEASAPLQGESLLAKACWEFV